MKRILKAIFTLVFCGALTAWGQSFPQEPEAFVIEARKVLEGVGSEAYDKVAYDFENAWNAKFRNSHREQTIGIANLMRKKGLPTYPYFQHFFAYLGFAVENEGVQADELTQLLEINLQSFRTLSQQEYANFLFEMSTFFGARFLHLGKSAVTKANGGSYDFELMGDTGDQPFFAIDTTQEVEIVEEDDFLTDEDIQNMNNQQVVSDDWGTNDPWATPSKTDDNSDDDWGNNTDPWANDPWAANDNSSSTDDSWGTTDDWGSNDDWGNNDTWDTGSDWGNVNTETSNFSSPAPVRPNFSIVEQDFAAMVRNKYIQPPSEGPVIHLKDIELVISTPFDSLTMNKVAGDQLLKSRIFAGKSGSLEWPAENTRMRGANVELGEFVVRVDRGELKSPNATLKYPGLFEGETEGYFEFKSIRRPKRALGPYPVFTSYDNDVKIKVADGNGTYEGGLQVKGNKFFGTSLSQKKGKLTIEDGKGRSMIIRSTYFILQDSLFRSNRASMTLYDGEDSIYHPSVQVRYDVSKKEVVVMRTKDYDVTPFHSTFHQMSFSGDKLTWLIEHDSINIDLVYAKDLLPATFESFDYFNPIRYKRLTGPFGFHPISLSVYYAKKFGIKEFNVQELVMEYDLDEKMVEGAMKMMHQYNLCEYDRSTGQVKLFDKAFHYYESSANKRDFDNLFVPSKLYGKPNATIRLDSGDLLVRGVDQFFVTTDFKIGIKPDEGEIVLRENRGIKFDGALEAGDFVYIGKDFIFDYDEFLVEMDAIDSIRIQFPPPDSVAHRPNEKIALQNHINLTSGTVYLEDPTNKSGLKDNTSFPHFISSKSAIVYFDGKEILNGAYDKSVKFIIPPMDMDSIDRESSSSIIFPGKFNSGGIFPTFEDTLHIMPDQSLGFIHHMPREGYTLYGTPARTYEKVTLSNKGLVGGGKIDFLNSTIFSEDFIYYPDSVTADGYYGLINPGTIGSTSFPQAEMGKFRMYWLPRKDSMYLKTIGDPFKFYNETAELTGEVNITQNGVYGSGRMLTRGSIAESNQLTFREYLYSARHARFEVLSDNPEKPAMAGDDIQIIFDLNLNRADLRPEEAGQASISFPYAQIRTSIPDGVWLLEDSVITMTKPERLPIEDSYFYSTRPQLDSLAFLAEKAIYDIQTYELTIEGIPFIKVADARVIPKGNKTTILENSVLETFKESRIVFEYPEARHYLQNATVDILSRNKFTASGTYLLPVQEDTFQIKMKDFQMEKFATAEGLVDSASAATGLVDEAMNLDIAAGFLYKGQVKLVANKQALELEGYVKPNFSTIPDHDKWIQFSRQDTLTQVVINIDNAVDENGEKVFAGLHRDSYTGRIYQSMIEERITADDEDFFIARGDLRYDADLDVYAIEQPGKSTGDMYQGHTLIYSDSSQNLLFEGKVNFVDPDLTVIKIHAAALGEGNRETNEFSIDAFLTIDLGLPGSFFNLMSVDILDIVARLGNPEANNLSIESMLKLANIIGEETTREYETESLKGYIPLAEVSEILNKNLVISGVKMKWSNDQNAWYNTTKLALSNINRDDVNAKVDGFIEFRKDDTGGDVMNLFIEAAPGSWYYFNYQENALLIYSSNKTLNQKVEEKSNFGKAKPGETLLIYGDENETLKFLNNFRKVYFGIDEPYNLIYPDDVSFEDDMFDTIQEDDDDGFGF